MWLEHLTAMGSTPLESSQFPPTPSDPRPSTPTPPLTACVGKGRVETLTDATATAIIGFLLRRLGFQQTDVARY